VLLWFSLEPPRTRNRSSSRRSRANGLAEGWLLRSRGTGAPRGAARRVRCRGTVLSYASVNEGDQPSGGNTEGRALTPVPNTSLCSDLPELWELFVACLAVCRSCPLGLRGRCFTYRTGLPAPRNSTVDSALFQAGTGLY